MARYKQEVQAAEFPSAEHSFGTIPERATPPSRGGLQAAPPASSAEPVRG